MKTVVITGASGFIGRYLVLEYLRNDYRVVAIVRNEKRCDEINTFLSRHSYSEKVVYIIRDLENLTVEDFHGIECDCWIHAGWAGVNRDGVNDELTQSYSYSLSCKCMDIVKELMCPMFIDIGSRAEYGITKGITYENSTEESLNTYGAYKRRFYDFAHEYCRKSGIRYIHARLFSVIGIGDHPWSLVNTACRNLMNNKNQQCGSCMQMWNYICVEDVANIIYMLSDNMQSYEEDNGIYNIANYESKKLKDYLEIIREIVGTDAKVLYGDGVGFDSYPITDKIRNIIGEYNFVPFEEKIKEIIDSYK